MLTSKQTRRFVPVLVSILPMFAMAEPVELRSPDGLISIDGEISAFDGTTITLETAVGEVLVEAGLIRCYGADCPEGVQRGLIEESVMVAGTSLANIEFASSFLKTASSSSSRLVEDGVLSLTNDERDQVALVSFAPSEAVEGGDVVITDMIQASELKAGLAPLTAWLDASAPTQLLAIKALSVVASPETGVDTVSLQQLSQIYAGEIVNWSELGGNDITITPIQAAEGSRLYADLHALVLDPAGKPASPLIFTMADSDTILKSLGAIPGAISLVPSDMTRDSHTLGVSNGCGVSTHATDFTVRSGDYPLTLSTLAVYEDNVETSVMHAAFDKAAAQGGYNLSADSGYASHLLMSLPNRDKNMLVSNIMGQTIDVSQQAAATDLIQLLFDGRQLSASFTDGDVSQTQGAWTRAHFIKLRDSILAGKMDDQEINFVGFNNDADGAQSLLASQEAAQNTLNAFAAFAPLAANRASVTLSAKGYGGLVPVSCFNNGVAEHSDSRVEVWVR